MDADDRGGWTQIFGGKANEPESPETSRRIVKRNFYLPYLHLALPFGVFPSEFHRDLSHHRGGSRILQGRVSNPSVRSTKDAETETPKASRGWGMGKGYPPPQPTRGSGGAS